MCYDYSVISLLEAYMITEKDMQIIAEQDNNFESLSFEPNKYTIPKDQLEDKLSEYGMLAMYKKWNTYLLENGYRLACPYEWDLKRGAIIYQYDSELSVTGDHSQDVVTIFAYLRPDKVLFVYDSSNLNYFYPGYEEDVPAVLDAFYKKHYDFINYYPPTHKIEIKHANDHPYFISEESDMVYYRFDDFARLAILLDREMNKRYPFNSVRDYEKREQHFLKKTLSEPLFFHPALQKDSDECMLEMIVGCSYAEAREDCTERARSILYSLTESNQDLVEPTAEAICKLETMTDEEYIELKDKIFNL